MRYGNILIEADQKGIISLELNPGPKEYSEKSIYLDRLEKWLKKYFNGKRRKANFPLVLKGTEFEKKVWKAMLRIPYDETRSYAWVAKQAGNVKAYRAAGTAVGKNPIAVVIPCHRVIKSDGSIGGFSSGLRWKRALQSIEKH